MGHAGALHVLEVGGELEKVANLVGGVVEELEEAAAAEVDAHALSFLSAGGLMSPAPKNRGNEPMYSPNPETTVAVSGFEVLAFGD